MATGRTADVVGAARPAARAYAFRHVVTFADVSPYGSVYFSRFVDWQGRCREMFLGEHAPEVLGPASNELVLVTLTVRCEFLAELRAFDEVTLLMRLGGMSRNRLVLDFEYVCDRDGGDRKVAARGQQEVACMARTAAGLAPTPIPEPLRRALAGYGP